MDISVLVSLLCGGVGFLASIIAVIIEAAKLSKTKAATKQNAYELTLQTAVVALMQKAEEAFESGEGVKKQDFVMNRLQLVAMNMGYDFDEQHWADYIETMIKFTKNVNAVKNVVKPKVI